MDSIPGIVNNYEYNSITVEMDHKTKVANLLHRLAVLSTVASEVILDQKRLVQLAGGDEWAETVIKAFTIWAESGDVEKFIEYAAAEGPLHYKKPCSKSTTPA